MTNVILGDGTIRFKIEGGKMNGETVSVDVVSAKLASEPVDKSHGSGEEEWSPTPEFLRDLAKAYVETGILPYCSPSMAYHVYFEVIAQWTGLKKSMEFLRTFPQSTDAESTTSEKKNKQVSTPT